MLYNPLYRDLSCTQDAEVAGLRAFYTEASADRISVVTEAEPLETSRLYEPFTSEVLDWFKSTSIPHMFLFDHDGRVCIEY